MSVCELIHDCTYTNVLMSTGRNQTDTEEVKSDDEMSEECFHCSQLIPLYQLRAHIQQCSARLVYKF